MGKTKFLLTHRSAVNRLECENGGAPMTEEGKEGEEREREKAGGVDKKSCSVQDS